jgi:hypothetical protein
MVFDPRCEVQNVDRDLPVELYGLFLARGEELIEIVG